MKFYNREKELKILETHWQHSGLVVDVLTGRRRIGKTQLSLEFAKHKKHLYFFVGAGIEKTEVCLGEIKLNYKRINKGLIKDLKQKANLPVLNRFKNKKLFVFTLEKVSDNLKKMLKQENILAFSLEESISQL